MKAWRLPEDWGNDSSAHPLEFDKMPFFIVETVFNSAGEEIEGGGDWGPHPTRDSALRELEEFKRIADHWTHDTQEKCWLARDLMGETHRFAIEERP